MALLEVWGIDRRRVLMTLDGSRRTVGKSADTDLVIPADTAVSRRHAVLESVGSGWAIRDLGSLNGTFVNGARLLGERALHDGDEIQLGRTKLVYRDADNPPEPSTDRVGKRPEITRREREVLVELCRPLLSGHAFSPPASVREIAQALFVGEAAVKQHLGHLYDKFQIADDGRQRRVELANEALESGAVRLEDLKES